MITQIIIISLSVYFIHACFWPNMIFGRIAAWLEARIPDKLTQPLFNCPICMTPWWGAGLYWIAVYTNIPYFTTWHWPTVIAVLFSAAGLNTILLQVNRIANTVNDWYEDHSEHPESYKD